jgi:hypothetical protein
MNKKLYEQISLLINEKIEDTYKYFEVYKYTFNKKVKKLKASPYSGHDVLELVENFNDELNLKCKTLLKEIDDLFINSGRKLSNSQYADLIKRCTSLFVSTIDGYYKAFQEEFEFKGTIKTSANVFRKNMASKISGHINALNIISTTKIDKALMWTAVGTVFAGISLLLSIIAIILT